jgi:putative transposase
LFVYGFVVMPEHVHLLVGEPEKGQLAQALQSLKQSVARRLALRAAGCPTFRAFRNVGFYGPILLGFSEI